MNNETTMEILKIHLLDLINEFGIEQVRDAIDEIEHSKKYRNRKYYKKKAGW